MRNRYFFALSLLLLAGTAHAYVGPGLGLGTIGAVFSAIFAFFLAIVGVVWYPLKRLAKRIFGKGGSTVRQDGHP